MHMASKRATTHSMDAKGRHKSQDKTFNVSATAMLTDEELPNQADDDDDEDDDGPVVFICAKCRLPVGDSLSWAGSEDDSIQIHLKRVTDNVLVGKESHIYEPIKRCRCLIVHLTCRGCKSLLGMVYVSTPKNMDDKRFKFCLNVADIDSYILGSANQMVAAENPEEQLVTLEYRGIVEQQLTEVATVHEFYRHAPRVGTMVFVMKTLVVSMAQRLEEIESGQQE